MFLIKWFVDLAGYRFILDIKTDLKQIIREGIMQFTSQLHCYSLYSFYKSNIQRVFLLKMTQCIRLSYLRFISHWKRYNICHCLLVKTAESKAEFWHSRVQYIIYIYISGTWILTYGNARIWPQKHASFCTRNLTDTWKHKTWPHTQPRFCMCRHFAGYTYNNIYSPISVNYSSC